MKRARRWASVALCFVVAASLCAAVPGPARAAQEVAGWDVSGYVEGGGAYVWGDTNSAKFDQYRDMDSGFLAEILLKAEKKDSPYYFSLYLQNPAREDMLGEAAIGRYGMFKLDLGWDRTPQVISNSARSIYVRSGDTFTLPPGLWPTIASTEQSVAGAGVNNPTNVANVAALINGLARPVDLSFNTDVGRAAFKWTPMEGLRFDIEYVNIHKDGYRPLSGIITGPGGSPNELAVPIDNWTSEVRVGAEYATHGWGLRFNYVGSFFNNEYKGYTWDNPLTTVNTGAAPYTTNRDRISADPNNSANTFSLTGTGALPLRTRLSGTFSYTMLRQDQDFEWSTQNPLLPRKNTDDAGNRSPDAAVNILQFNFLATTRPIDMLTITARYRYFDYNNDTPVHTFTNYIYPTGTGAPQSGEGTHESYTTQNAGIDFALRPWSMLMLRAGYEWVHWDREDYGGDDFTNTTNIFKLAADFTPWDWFLARLTYSFADRSLSGHEEPAATAGLPKSTIYMWAPAKTNRLDALFQFSFWENITPSLSASFSNNNFDDNQFGLLSNNYWSVGIDVSWVPAKALSLSGNFSYEKYTYEMASRYNTGGVFPGIDANNWNSKSEDQYYNVGANVIWDVIPKKFSLNLGYAGSFGTTSITTSNPNFVNTGAAANQTANPQAVAYNWQQVENNRQTVTVIAKYNLTEKLSLRGGFAYEKFNTQDPARDPMAPFMGYYDKAGTNPASNTVPNTSGVQSVFLGSTYGNYEAYIISAFVRYEF
jgi:MtrB/PioB family decaheme-associated outer membrane protein